MARLQGAHPGVTVVVSDEKAAALRSSGYVPVVAEEAPRHRAESSPAPKRATRSRAPRKTKE